MSKTRKTDPLWVKEQRDGYIKHDHTHGECCVEPTGHPRPYWKTHSRSRCPKIYWVEEPCGNSYCYDLYNMRRTAQRLGQELPQSCGKTHRYARVNPDVPCPVCDEPQPTCCWTLGNYGTYQEAVGDTPTSWWRRHMVHAPNRVQRRETARRIVKEYNAGARADCDCENCLRLEDDWAPAPVYARAGWWD